MDAPRDRDFGRDLPLDKVTAAFWDRKCPRCLTRAERPDSRRWNPLGMECIWRAEDAEGGFKCRKELRDERNRRRP